MTKFARAPIRSVVVAGALAFAAVLLLPAARADCSAEDNAAADDITTVFADQLNAAGISGGSYVTAAADGTITARGVGTTSDDDPVTADTPFMLGSTTKSFTALAVMQLVDSGKVELDAPVTRYVPEFRLADGEPVDEITVRRLLQHTSGLDDLTGGPILASGKDGTALAAIAELRSARLASTPGDTWRYANANYVLAGLVVERASGTSYADYLQRAILDPLGMTQTSIGTDPAVAAGHQYWFGLTAASGPVQRAGVVAAGYLASTASDLGKYLSMYLRQGRALDGTRVVSANGIRTLTAPGPQAHLGGWADGATARYAMGWFVGGPWAEAATFHPGNTPDSSAMIALFPGRDLAAATLIPASQELPVPGNPTLPDRIARHTLHAVLGEPVPPPTSRWGFYAVFDLVAAGLLGFGAWSVARAVKARRRSPAGAVRRWLQPLPSLLSAVVVTLLPRLAGFSWAGMWTWAPDLTVLLQALAALAAATTGVRLATAVRSTMHQARSRSLPTGQRTNTPPAGRPCGFPLTGRTTRAAGFGRERSALQILAPTESFKSPCAGSCRVRMLQPTSPVDLASPSIGISKSRPRGQGQCGTFAVQYR